MKEFVRNFLFWANIVSGLTAGILGIFGSADMVLGAKYLEILENFNLSWIANKFWLMAAIVMAIFITTYLLRKKFFGE